MYILLKVIICLLYHAAANSVHKKVLVVISYSGVRRRPHVHLEPSSERGEGGGEGGSVYFFRKHTESVHPKDLKNLYMYIFFFF